MDDFFETDKPTSTPATPKTEFQPVNRDNKAQEQTQETPVHEEAVSITSEYAEITDIPTQEKQAPVKKSKKALVGGLIGAGAAGILGVLVLSNFQTSEPDVLLAESSQAQETDTPVESVTPEPEVVEQPTPEPVISEAPEVVVPEVELVKETIAIEYAPLSAELSDADQEALTALAAQPLADNEEVVISGFAGFSAGEEWANTISQKRAEVIEDFLTDQGLDTVTVAYGTTPAGSVLGEAMEQAAEGINHNRLSFVSAVVVKS